MSFTAVCPPSGFERTGKRTVLWPLQSVPAASLCIPASGANLTSLNLEPMYIGNLENKSEVQEMVMHHTKQLKQTLNSQKGVAPQGHYFGCPEEADC